MLVKYPVLRKVPTQKVKKRLKEKPLLKNWEPSPKTRSTSKVGVSQRNGEGKALSKKLVMIKENPLGRFLDPQGKALSSI